MRDRRTTSMSDEARDAVAVIVMGVVMSFVAVAVWWVFKGRI